MNIYESINAIMQEVPAIAKDRTNLQQNFKYRSIEQVMNALQPILAKHKVFVVPQILEQIREERQTQKRSNLIYSILKVKFTFYAEDGTFVEAITTGEGMDSGDKASNKAMAVAMKYALFQTFCIPTEDDPDGESHDIKPKKITKEQSDVLYSALSSKGYTDEQVKQSLSKYKVTKIDDLNTAQYEEILHKVNKGG